MNRRAGVARVDWFTSVAHKEPHSERQESDGSYSDTGDTERGQESGMFIALHKGSLDSSKRYTAGCRSGSDRKPAVMKWKSQVCHPLAASSRIVIA
jgi:hypothetical protein